MYRLILLRGWTVTLMQEQANFTEVFSQGIYPSANERWQPNRTTIIDIRNRMVVYQETELI
jgi:hypothetical protein